MITQPAPEPFALAGDTAEREDRYDTFTLRTIRLRQTHARKPSLIDRLNRARI